MLPYSDKLILCAPRFFFLLTKQLYVETQLITYDSKHFVFEDLLELVMLFLPTSVLIMYVDD